MTGLARLERAESDDLWAIEPLYLRASAAEEKMAAKRYLTIHFLKINNVGQVCRKVLRSFPFQLTANLGDNLMVRHGLLTGMILLLLVTYTQAADKRSNRETGQRGCQEDDPDGLRPTTGKKDYDVNDDTKFIGPKGGKSDKGIKDDRLVKGAELKTNRRRQQQDAARSSFA